ncbi:MAG TPA: hypothetical protein VJT31_14105 [Rugosimonospora sp.]|nr:hypothetical protein [Rugosimonospora sp.]
MRNTIRAIVLAAVVGTFVIVAPTANVTAASANHSAATSSVVASDTLSSAPADTGDGFGWD